MTASMIPGETVINNASEAVEVVDLINFLRNSGVTIIQEDPKTIRVIGTNIFKGVTHKVRSDITEAVNFATIAALTKGNIVIEGVEKTAMTAFSSFLSKLGVKFEFDRDELKVWNNLSVFEPMDLNVGPQPAFMTEWHPNAALLLTQAKGVSHIHETVFLDRFSYIMDLNRMGADIKRTKPTDIGVNPVVSDDSYDINKYGIPESLLVIRGPSKLRGSKLDIGNVINGPVVVNAALGAEGRSQISGWENIESIFENYIEKIHKLGAKISVD
jgi:UDP-N-acetylglucosamine 1-carboxyvinyltransferase